jgi:choice-of-anchor C domain-containing protein
MSRNRKVSYLLAPLFAYLALVASASAMSLLVNGSFEVGPTVPEDPGYLPLGNGDTSIDGWVIHSLASGGTVDLVRSPYWEASDGLNSVDLNGTPGPGSISQTFPSTTGAQYRVLFDIASNPAHPTIFVKTMLVSAGGQSQQFSADSTGHTYESMGWETREWYFTATGANTTLTFGMVSPFGSNQGVALDNVSVSQVPEPTTISMAVLAFLLLPPRRWSRT